jgi:hypothetical protein
MPCHSVSSAPFVAVGFCLAGQTWHATVPEWRTVMPTPHCLVTTPRSLLAQPFSQHLAFTRPGRWKLHITPAALAWTWLVRHRDADPFRALAERDAGIEVVAGSATVLQVRLADPDRWPEPGTGAGPAPFAMLHGEYLSAV